MVLRLGLEADLKVTLELKKDTWQWQPHWFLSEADHRLVGGGWDRVCVARGGQDWAQARSQEDHHLQQVALTFSIYSKIKFSHILELGTRISSPLSCWRSVSRATLSSGETAESIFFLLCFSYQVLLLTFLLDVLTNPQNIMTESVMIQLGLTFTECSKSRHLRSVEKD